MPNRSVFPLTRVAVGAALQLLRRFETGGSDVLTVWLKNEGANPMSAFELRARVCPEQRDAVAVKSANFAVEDFWSVASATTEPGSLAAGASALVPLNVALCDSVELWGQSSAGCTLAIAGGSYQEA